MCDDYLIEAINKVIRRLNLKVGSPNFQVSRLSRAGDTADKIPAYLNSYSEEILPRPPSFITSQVRIIFIHPAKAI